MVAINIVLATLMASYGWAMAAVSLQSIATLLIITLVAMLILDGSKVCYYQVAGILKWGVIEKMRTVGSRQPAVGSRQ